MLQKTNLFKQLNEVYFSVKTLIKWLVLGSFIGFFGWKCMLYIRTYACMGQ